MHHLKIIILIICLAFTSIFIYWQPSTKVEKEYELLKEAFADIKGWPRSVNSPLTPQLVEFLDLDDYININYYRNGESVSLYIGYYYNAKKISASHSPLVCFPAQGWVLSDRERQTILIGENAIHLEKMIATLGRKNELLLYWFQTYDKTSAGTVRQKLNSFLLRLQSKPENNSFVRVSVPIQDENHEKAYQTGIDYIKSFYPQFLAFIKSGSFLPD